MNRIVHTHGEGLSCDMAGNRQDADRTWQASQVADRLKEAAETLRATSLGLRDRPRRLRANWPDVVKESLEYMWEHGNSGHRSPPSPAAISRADESVVWLLWAMPEERRILWGRACGIAWRRLEDLDGRSHTTLRKIRQSGLSRICETLNAQKAGTRT